MDAKTLWDMELAPGNIRPLDAEILNGLRCADMNEPDAAGVPRALGYLLHGLRWFAAWNAPSFAVEDYGDSVRLVVYRRHAYPLRVIDERSFQRDTPVAEIVSAALEMLEGETIRREEDREADYRMELLRDVARGV